MTLNEDTDQPKYSASSSSSVHVDDIKAHRIEVMKDKFNHQQSQPTTTSAADVVNENHRSIVDSPTSKVSIVMNDGNNNSDKAKEYRSYIKFDESINKLPEESLSTSVYKVSGEFNDCHSIVNPNFHANMSANSSICTPINIPSSSTAAISTIFTDVNLNEDKTDRASSAAAASENNDLSTRIVRKLRVIPCAGVILAMLSGVFFATAGFIVKLIPDINPIQIVICRSIIQSIAYLPPLLYFRSNFFGEPGERLAVQIRGIFGFFAFTLCYVSYRLIPLADASTIVFSAPVYVSVFACILLKEECGVFQAFSVIITIIGVLLISKPTFIFGDTSDTVVDVTMRLEGTIIAFFASLSAALTFVMMRKLQRTSSPVVINMFSVVSIILGIITLAIIRNFFYEEAGQLAEGVGLPNKAWDYYWLIANGLCGVFGQLCLTVSLKIEEAGLVSLARTIDIVMAFIFQISFLKQEQVHWTSILGAVIVCFGVCISALRRWLRSKPGKYKHLWLILNCGIPRPDENEFSLEKSNTTVNSPVNGSHYKANIQSFADLTKLSNCNQVTEGSSRRDEKV